MKNKKHKKQVVTKAEKEGFPGLEAEWIEEHPLPDYQVYKICARFNR